MTTLKKLSLTVFLLLVAVVLFAQIQMTYTFENPLLKSTDDGYTEIVFDKCYNMGEEGSPLLPYYGADILLPPGTEVKDIRLISITTGEAINNITIQPAARQFPISKGAPDGYKPLPDPAIYSLNKVYPAMPTSIPVTHFLAGHSIASFTVCPVIYNPVQKSISLISSITIEIVSQVTSRADQASEKLKNHPSQIKRIHKIVDNKDALDQYSYADHKTSEFDILFITDQVLEPFFQAYISFKTETGFLVKTLTTNYIYANYNGADNQEKIRNCIIDYYTNFNIFAVILGGDADKNNSATNFVPHRGFYGFYNNDYDLPADMYYSCLDGNWNNDGDYRWGEPGEDDLFAEVIIGRLAVDDATEIEHFMHKQLMYQDQPVVGDIEKALMIGESLDASTWGGDSKDEVAMGSSNYGYTTVGVSSNFSIENLYERNGGWNKNDVFAQFNTTGVNLLNHLGHSNTYYNMKMYNSDVNTTNFTNDGVTRGYPIGYSQGCYNGAFDNRGTSPSSYGADCFAEKITTIETAEVACVSNSRYGFYSPGNTNGASQYFDREFYDAIFGEDLTMIGEANSDSKEDNAGFIASSSVLRWCCYILNVFGDPTMDIWTATPTSITATYPTEVPLESLSIAFQTDAPEARIGLMQNGELIGRGLTNANGYLMLNLFSQLANLDTIHVSIIAHNRLRHVGTILSVNAQAFVSYESHSINDTLTGNGNGLCEYGETAKLSLEVTNLGQEEATDVTVYITSSDPYVIITDSVEYYGNISEGQLVTIDEGFEFSLTDDVPDWKYVSFTLRAEGQENWESNFFQVACAPRFTSALLSVDDSGSGNGNGYLDPGETVDLHIQIINSGHSRALDISSLISTDDTLVTIISNTSFVNTLEVGEIFEAIYTVSTHPLSPLGAPFELIHDIEAGPYVTQRVYAINNGVICEDWETGDFNHFNWTHSGQADWEIISVDPFEGVYSAKSGSIDDGQNSTIQITLAVQQDDSISFYRKISSEASDFLNFYINDELKGQWAGEEEWARFSFPIDEGVTLFKWEYAKNATSSSGDDCAWLDYIVLPFVNTASAYAGPDQLVCETGICLLNGQVINSNSIEWTSSGDGSFDDPMILDPVYTPGSDDIINGEVFLTLGATVNQTGTTFDQMYLEINGDPGIPPIPDGPEYVDLLTVITSDYMTSALPSVIEYEWQLEPVEAGIVEGNGLTGTVTWEQTYHGLAYVSVRAIDTCGTGLYSDPFEVLVDEGGLGIGVLANEAGISIYPNPNTGSFTIAAKVSQAGHYSIHAYNLIGKIMAQQTDVYLDGENTVTVNFRDLPEGLYFIVIEGQGEKMIRKLIINH
jgi:hypothetical protein